MPLACSLIGREGAILLTPGSLASGLLGAERSLERYHRNYGASATHLDTLRGLATAAVTHARAAR
ncbi:hypothetical protein GCM10010331_63410 [Streptomyces xanthochromogenes]|uniref:hypothetical protein n=1 Tax=Streptomyces xanthochromogenes TaxID=67384 RepID=UPI001676C495|nr:hypothetical protein [Streptomyces xanthochromogenes]GHB66702.1 hypothetical protein GCM10010331_63410 [Streptomyces xanthochromogenes]